MCGKLRSEGGMRDLPKRFPAAILVDQHDTFEMRVAVDAPLKIAKSFIVRVVCKGVLARDIR